METIKTNTTNKQDGTTTDTKNATTKDNDTKRRTRLGTKASKTDPINASGGGSSAGPSDIASSSRGSGTSIGGVVEAVTSMSISDQGASNTTEATIPALSGVTSQPVGAGGGGGQSSTSKRGRSETTTPTSDTSAKKSKVSNSPVSGTAANLSLQVLVRSVGGRQLDQSMVQELLKALYVWLDGVPSGASRPTFDGHRLNNGVFVVQCANKHSVDWLVKAVGEIDTIGETKLSAIPADAVPPKRKVAFTVADPDGAKPEIIFKRLRDSNSGLDTSEWVYLSKFVNNGAKGLVTTHLVGVDSRSVEFIQQHNKRLYYMLQSVTCDIRGPLAPGHFPNKGKAKPKPRGTVPAKRHNPQRQN